MEFEGIEGGFGEGKRCMLVKDIARLHNQPLSEINRRINNNRDRFKDGVDIIDCLNGSEPFRNFAEDNGFIGSNRTKNVYILSERGYSKLLKILEDDLAWEQYDKLVDGYFTMRGNQLSPQEQLALQSLVPIQEISSILQDMKTLTERSSDNISKYESMLRVNCSKKTNFTRYIKNRLGIRKVNDEFEAIKSRVFCALGVSKWEDINLQQAESVLRLIDEGVTEIIKNRPYEQINWF